MTRTSRSTLATGADMQSTSFWGTTSGNCPVWSERPGTQARRRVSDRFVAAQRATVSDRLRSEHDGNVWVTALAPIAGLTAEEFGWLARLVASEADRLEYRLTGKDNW